MAVFAFAAAFLLCINTPRATPESPAAHRRGRGTRRVVTEHRYRSRYRSRRNMHMHRYRHVQNMHIGGISITYERGPPRTLGGRGLGGTGTGKAQKPPQTKRRSKFYVFRRNAPHVQEFEGRGELPVFASATYQFKFCYVRTPVTSHVTSTHVHVHVHCRACTVSD